MYSSPQSEWSHAAFKDGTMEMLFRFFRVLWTGQCVADSLLLHSVQCEFHYILPSSGNKYCPQEPSLRNSISVASLISAVNGNISLSFFLSTSKSCTEVINHDRM